MVYEQKYEDYVSRIEMCYWNESDGKHKLFADNRWSFEKGKPILGQYDGLSFYRYDHATKKMARCNTARFRRGILRQILCPASYGEGHHRHDVA